MNSEVTIVLRSGTQAMKAERILYSAGIDVSVVKPDTDMTGNGCGYGIKVRANAIEGALKVLKNAGITPGKTFGGRR